MQKTHKVERMFFNIERINIKLNHLFAGIGGVRQLIRDK